MTIRPTLRPTLRPGRDEDGPGLIDLIGACWAEYPSIVFDVDAELPELHAFASHLHGRGGALWVAEADGVVVGMAAAHPEADEWRLSKLYVAASQRGAGRAETLLRGAEQHARAAGGARMMLWSDMLFTRAHAFYAKQGYVRRGGLRALDDLSHSIEAMFAKPLAGLAVEELDVAAAESAERPLAAMLKACVDSGASVSFLPPLARSEATRFWRKVTHAVGRGEARLFAAWLDGKLCGTVQLGLDMPPNQPHRADIRKMLVSPECRRHGVGRAMLQEVENQAMSAGLRLLVLDTVADGAGEFLYRSLGWSFAGTIPGYALDGQGQPLATRFFFKAL